MTVLRSLLLLLPALVCSDDPFCAIRASLTCLGPDSPCQGVSIPTAEECNQDVEIDILDRYFFQLPTPAGGVNTNYEPDIPILGQRQEADRTFGVDLCDISSPFVISYTVTAILLEDDSIELVVPTRYQEENDNTCQKRSLFDRRGK